MGISWLQHASIPQDLSFVCVFEWRGISARDMRAPHMHHVVVNPLRYMTYKTRASDDRMRLAAKHCVILKIIIIVSKSAFAHMHMQIHAHAVDDVHGRTVSLVDYSLRLKICVHAIHVCICACLSVHV